MLAHHPVRTFGAVLLAAALAAIVGCSSSGRIEEGDKAIEGFEATRQRLQKAQGQVDATLASLDRVAAGGDMRKPYQAYCDNLEELEEAGRNAAKRAQKMRENMQEYVAKWQSEMEKMNDPTIKAGLQQRRNAVSANFDRVRSTAQAAREAYDPFMARLQEIRKALAIDLSPNALPGLKPAMDQAKAQGQTLKQKLSAMQGELDKILSGTSASGTASAR
jgi:chromosome segregation ATPase